MIRGRVTLDDYAPRSFEAVLGHEESVHVALKAIPRGSVMFRLRPATSKVFIDGAEIHPGNELIVKRELPVGPHHLEVLGPDGTRVERSFEVVEGKDTNLYTLNAERASGAP